MTSPQPTPQTPTESTTAAPTQSATTTAPPLTWTPDQQAELDRRAAAARREGLEAGRKAAEEAATEAQRLADEKRKQDEAVARGDFDKVRTDLESKVSALTTERDDFKQRYEDALAQIAPGVESDWKACPDELKAGYAGADGDPLARAAYLARMKPARDALEAQRGTTPRTPMTPRPNGDAKPEVTSLVNTKNF